MIKHDKKWRCNTLDARKILNIVWIYAATTFFTGMAGMVVYILEVITYERFSNLSVVFLIPILCSAIYYGTLPAIYSSIFSCFVFDYFFIPPFFTLTQGTDNAIKFIVFVIASVITSLLAGKVRSYALAIEEKERKISLLYKLGEKMANASSTEGVILSARNFMKESLHLDMQVILQPEGMSEEEFTQSIASNELTAIPLRAGNIILGVMQFRALDKKMVKDYSGSVAAQIAVGIERMQLYEAKEKALIDKEREVLRSALLSSISHDLKTPLSSIMSAASMLKLSGKPLSQEHHAMLVSTIEDEAERLHRFIVNLLEITKLESGTILPNCEAVNIDDVIDSTLKRMRTRLEHHIITIKQSDDLPFISLDSALMQHVFMNLLENAVKYSDAGTEIIIQSTLSEENFIIEVKDEGLGIPSEDLEKVFNKFYRVYRTDSQVAGTGLGLAICQSIISAHEGRIFLKKPSKGKGITACIHFPLSRTSTPPTLEILKESA